MSQTLGGHFINVIHMFCVCWDSPQNHGNGHLLKKWIMSAKNTKLSGLSIIVVHLYSAVAVKINALTFYILKQIETFR